MTIRSLASINVHIRAKFVEVLVIFGAGAGFY